MRIYPVPFRRLDEAERYSKYDWIECHLHRRTADPRPESFSPGDLGDLGDLRRIGKVGTANNWSERRRLLLETARVYDNLDELINGAKCNELSLAVFRPTTITGFISESEDRDWDAKRLEQMRNLHGQLDLFEDNSWRKTFTIIPKLPYSFSYRFEDSVGRKSELQILDWEAGALYWNCLKSTDGDESQALSKVREKYFEAFLKTNLHFFLGTTQQFHQVAPNPWVIIGVLPIPHDSRLRLL